MRMAFMTLRGILNYRDDVLDTFVLPEGIDAEHFKAYLVDECGEFEILYPQPDVLKSTIGFWSYAHLKNWEKLLETENYEYEPLENYDRIEEWTDDGNTSGGRDYTSKDSRNSTRKDIENVESIASSTSTGNTTEDSPGFNVSAGDVTVKTVYTDGGSNADSSVDTTRDETITDARDLTDKEMTTGTSKSVHTGRIHGNIGVTTSQQMIESQRQVVLFNTIDYIVNEFKTRFCLCIY